MHASGGDRLHLCLITSRFCKGSHSDQQRPTFEYLKNVVHTVIVSWTPPVAKNKHTAGIDATPIKLMHICEE